MRGKAGCWLGYIVSKVYLWGRQREYSTQKFEFNFISFDPLAAVHCGFKWSVACTTQNSSRSCYLCKHLETMYPVCLGACTGSCSPNLLWLVCMCCGIWNAVSVIKKACICCCPGRWYSWFIQFKRILAALWSNFWHLLAVYSLADGSSRELGLFTSGNGSRRGWLLLSRAFDWDQT